MGSVRAECGAVNDVRGECGECDTAHLRIARYGTAGIPLCAEVVAILSAVMGAQGAVNILYRKELADAKNPEKKRAELVTEYEDTFANPYIAAERGYVDAVIPPHDTRAHVVRALRALRNKRETRPARKHGNIPL